MNKRFRLSSRMAGKLEELGLEPAAVLRHAGLPPGLFSQGRVLLTTGEFFAVLEAVGTVSGDPAIGLKVGTETRLDRLDAISLVALSTARFGEALERMACYKRLTCPEEIEIASGPDACSIRFCWLLAQETEPDILVDLCFAWVLSIARLGTGARVSPLRVEFARAPRNARLYEKHFGCPVIFDAGRNALLFDPAEFHRPFVTQNAELLSMLAPQLDAELRERHRERRFPEQVGMAIKRRLAGQRPAIEDIASEFHMSPRTLQRRLKEHGSNFQELVAEARRELARHYLADSELELSETAYLLGYEDSNSFVRAFHGWEGLPPAQWRARLSQ